MSRHHRQPTSHSRFGRPVSQHLAPYTSSASVVIQAPSRGGLSKHNEPPLTQPGNSLNAPGSAQPTVAILEAIAPNDRSNRHEGSSGLRLIGPRTSLHPVRPLAPPPVRAPIPHQSPTPSPGSPKQLEAVTGPNHQPSPTPPQRATGPGSNALAAQQSVYATPRSHSRPCAMATRPDTGYDAPGRNRSTRPPSPTSQQPLPFMAPPESTAQNRFHLQPADPQLSPCQRKHPAIPLCIHPAKDRSSAGRDSPNLSGNPSTIRPEPQTRIASPGRVTDHRPCGLGTAGPSTTQSRVTLPCDHAPALYHPS